MALLHGALSDSVLAAFYEAYRHLGDGMLEKHCASALEDELRTRGHEVGREVSVGVWYKGRLLGTQRLDMIVDGKLVIEVKSMDALHPSAHRQLLNYLRVTMLEVGLPLNFGPKPTFKRVVFTNDRKRQGVEERRRLAEPSVLQSATSASTEGMDAGLAATKAGPSPK